MNIEFSWTKETAKSNEQFLNLTNCLLLIDPWEENARDLAVYIAKLNLCKEKSACGTCQSCKLFEADTHPDFIFHPEPLKIKEIRGEPVEKIKGLLEKITLTPSISKERFIFLGKIDQYLGSSINALLKTLEEPPLANHFILSAKAKRAVLPTVLSRSMVLTVALPEFEECKNYLTSQGLSPSEAERGLEIYNHNPFLVLKNKDLLNPYDYLGDFQKYLQNPAQNRLFLKKLREIPEKEKLELVIKLCEKTISEIQLVRIESVNRKLLALHNLLAALYRLKRPYLRQINQAYAINDLMFRYLEG